MQPSENPYASPSPDGLAPEPAVSRQLIQRRLFPPAVMTIVGGVLMLLAIGLNIALVIGISKADPDAASSIIHLYRTTPWMLSFLFLVCIGSVVCIYGGVQILRLKQYPVCVATAIIMAFPFSSPCSWIGLVVGIWTLVILVRKDTRAAFKEAH